VPQTVIADVRMLAYPFTGIGRYTYELLTRLIPTTRAQWILLSARPISEEVKRAFGEEVQWLEGDGTHRAEGWMQWHASRALRRHPAAIFLGLSNSLPFFGPRAREYFLVVYDLCFFVVPLLTHPKDLIKGYAVVWPAIRKAGRILAISPQVESELHRYVPSTRNRTTALPPGGTRFPNLHSKPFADRSGFLSVGAHRRKNTGLLLEAYAQLSGPLRRRHPLFVLAREFPGKLQQTIDRLGIRGDVRLQADASDGDLSRLYERSIALVFPSAYEGLGLPVAEALLAGLPAIVPDPSPMAGFLNGCGVAIANMGPRELSEAMRRIATEPDLWKDRASACGRAAGIVGWDKVADAVRVALRLD